MGVQHTICPGAVQSRDVPCFFRHTEDVRGMSRHRHNVGTHKVEGELGFSQERQDASLGPSGGRQEAKRCSWNGALGWVTSSEGPLGGQAAGSTRRALGHVPTHLHGALGRGLHKGVGQQGPGKHHLLQEAFSESWSPTTYIATAPWLLPSDWTDQKAQWGLLPSCWVHSGTPGLEGLKTDNMATQSPGSWEGQQAGPDCKTRQREGAEAGATRDGGQACHNCNDNSALGEWRRHTGPGIGASLAPPLGVAPPLLVAPPPARPRKRPAPSRWSPSRRLGSVSILPLW